MRRRERRSRRVRRSKDVFEYSLGELQVYCQSWSHSSVEFASGVHGFRTTRPGLSLSLAKDTTLLLSLSDSIE